MGLNYSKINEVVLLIQKDLHEKRLKKKSYASFQNSVESILKEYCYSEFIEGYFELQLIFPFPNYSLHISKKFPYDSFYTCWIVPNMIKKGYHSTEFTIKMKDLALTLFCITDKS